MSNIVQLQIQQFLLIYLLLIVVILIMKKCRIDQSKLLVLASIKMSVQLVIAGLILTYIFKHPHPLFTLLYVTAMTGFAIHRVISKNKGVNKRFKIVIALSIAFSGLLIIIYFIVAVVGENLFNPQYVIPISGMIMGNVMTGVSLGVKTFREANQRQKEQQALLCIGADPAFILMPLVRQSLQTAMLPTINSMVGMGIVALPGMMTGQILAGTLPTTAILYQIAIMIAICTAVTSACFGSLYFGFRTLYNKETAIIERIESK